MGMQSSCGGLHEELVQEDIVCCFEQFGTVDHAKLPLRHDGTTKNRGFAFVRFQDPRSCELAIDNMQEVEIAGRKLRVEAARPPSLQRSETNQDTGERTTSENREADGL
mmetsp:Transcript_18531/g.37668  ORF Transcript_18531/g.37668 Transcript_18531/m.37668 type:complete len:109 (+) Transcript_18531:280-606(+)